MAKKPERFVIALTGFAYGERHDQVVRQGAKIAAKDPIAKRYPTWFAPAESTEAELRQAQADAGLPFNYFFR